jgi:hypothetical protein
MLKNVSSDNTDKMKKPSDTEPKVMTPTRVDVEVRFETKSMRFADRWRRRKKSKDPASVRFAEEGLADGIEDVESLVEEATRLESEAMDQNLLNDQRLTEMTVEWRARRCCARAELAGRIHGFTAFGALASLVFDRVLNRQ